MTTSTKTIAFFGASTGVGLSALEHTLAAGHQCIALCRTPSKLTSIFSPDKNPNLQVIQGNAHDVTSVSACLQSNGRIVDAIVSSIGAKPVLSRNMMDDPKCCQKGANVLIRALQDLRKAGMMGSPHIIEVSTTGISKFGRDIPLLMVPLYKVMLRVPHVDKEAMEDKIVESGEKFTIMHASLLTNGEVSNEVRIGVEDPKKGRESAAIGYTVSRKDTGKWIADHLILGGEERYMNKVVMITY